MRRAILGGVGIGGAAGALYRWTNASLLNPYMTDPSTNARVRARHAQSEALDTMLKAAAPQVKAASRAAIADCGALDLSCKQKRAAAKTELERLRATLRETAARVPKVNKV